MECKQTISLGEFFEDFVDYYISLSNKERKDVVSTISGKRYSSKMESIVDKSSQDNTNDCDTMKIKLRASIDNASGIDEQIKNLQDKLDNLKISVKIVDDEPMFKSINEMREIYRKSSINEDAANNLIREILEDLEIIVRSGGSFIVRELAHPLLEKEVDYVSRALNKLGYLFTFNEDGLRLRVAIHAVPLNI